MAVGGKWARFAGLLGCSGRVEEKGVVLVAGVGDRSEGGIVGACAEGGGGRGAQRTR